MERGKDKSGTRVDAGGDIRVPWSIRLYWVLAAAIAIAVAAIETSEGESVSGLLALVVVLTFATLVYRRSRVAWVVVCASGAGRLALGLVSPQSAWVAGIEVVNVVLLVAPSSLRFIWGGPRDNPARGSVPPAALRSGGVEAREGGQSERRLALDGLAFDDQDRPAGWYIDPESPRRMRFWTDGGAWVGKTRTPRTLLTQWELEREGK